MFSRILLSLFALVCVLKCSVLAIQLPPGFTSCGTANDAFQVSIAELSPFPPRKGRELNTNLQGVVSKTIEQGATIHVTAKLGFVPVWFTTLDLCESTGWYGVNCPITAGDRNITFKTDIPGITPSIPINLEISAKNKNGEQIICFNGRFVAQS